MSLSAQTYIQALQMQEHPEGGFFKESYRSTHLIDVSGASDTAPVRRSVCTVIYFLLEKDNFSAFHRIKSDEMWHFYAGQALEVLELRAKGELIRTLLGPDILRGHVHQYVVHADTWFASRVVDGGVFALVGCTVAPGFDFADFCLAEREALLASYPRHRDIIQALTR
jgi:uncharacterized protein